MMYILIHSQNTVGKAVNDKGVVIEKTSKML